MPGSAIVVLSQGVSGHDLAKITGPKKVEVRLAINANFRKISQNEKITDHSHCLLFCMYQGVGKKMLGLRRNTVKRNKILSKGL